MAFRWDAGGSVAGVQWHRWAAWSRHPGSGRGPVREPSSGEVAAAAKTGSVWLAPLAGLVAGAAAGAAVAASDSGHDAFGAVVLNAVVVGAPVVTGLYALRTPQFERFGRFLLVLAALGSLAFLSHPAASLPYSTGRLAA